MRNCRLVGLRDLALGKEYVRGKIVDFMNKAIGYGVAGFRYEEFTFYQFLPILFWRRHLNSK